MLNKALELLDQLSVKELEEKYHSMQQEELAPDQFPALPNKIEQLKNILDKEIGDIINKDEKSISTTKQEALNNSNQSFDDVLKIAKKSADHVQNIVDNIFPKNYKYKKDMIDKLKFIHDMFNLSGYMGDNSGSYLLTFAAKIEEQIFKQYQDELGDINRLLLDCENHLKNKLEENSPSDKNSAEVFYAVDNEKISIPPIGSQKDILESENKYPKETVLIAKQLNAIEEIKLSSGNTSNPIDKIKKIEESFKKNQALLLKGNDSYLVAQVKKLSFKILDKINPTAVSTFFSQSFILSQRLDKKFKEQSRKKYSGKP